MEFGSTNSTTVNFTNAYTYSLANGVSIFSANSIVSFGAGGTALDLGSPVTINGTLVINKDYTMTGGALNLASGSLGGSGNIQVGTFTWSGGNLVGSGSLTTSAFTFSAPIASLPSA